MDFTWVFPNQQKGIIKKVYEQHKKNEDNENKEFYYLTTLAKDLNKKKQDISSAVATLIEKGIIKVVEEKAGPNKGKVKYLDLTDDAIALWKYLATPTVDEIKKTILEYKEVYAKDPEPELVAAKLGKNPQNKDIMDLIYAVLAMPEVKDYKVKRCLA